MQVFCIAGLLDSTDAVLGCWLFLSALSLNHLGAVSNLREEFEFVCERESACSHAHAELYLDLYHQIAMCAMRSHHLVLTSSLNRPHSTKHMPNGQPVCMAQAPSGKMAQLWTLGHWSKEKSMNDNGRSCQPKPGRVTRTPAPHFRCCTHLHTCMA